MQHSESNGNWAGLISGSRQRVDPHHPNSTCAGQGQGGWKVASETNVDDEVIVVFGIAVGWCRLRELALVVRQKSKQTVDAHDLVTRRWTKGDARDFAWQGHDQASWKQSNNHPAAASFDAFRKVGDTIVRRSLGPSGGAQRLLLSRVPLRAWRPFAWHPFLLSALGRALGGVEGKPLISPLPLCLCATFHISLLCTVFHQ